MQESLAGECSSTLRTCTSTHKVAFNPCWTGEKRLSGARNDETGLSGLATDVGLQSTWFASFSLLVCLL